MDTQFTIVSSPAMQVKEAAEEREYLAQAAAADLLLVDDEAGPHWQAVERAEGVLSKVDVQAMRTIQALDVQNDARGREIARLRARVAEALQRIDAGPQMVNDRVEEHWSVVAHGAASVLRAAHTDH